MPTYSPGDVNFTDSRIWLLAPNKTDATSYLDGDGEKPERYARAMGQGDCFAREYMVGYVCCLGSILFLLQY
jgi:hypothetical protein